MKDRKIIGRCIIKCINLQPIYVFIINYFIEFIRLIIFIDKVIVARNKHLFKIDVILLYVLG